MSLSLGIFFVILVLFSLRGYVKGFFGALSNIVSLTLAYITAFLLVKPAARLLQEHTELEGILVYLIAGLIIFTVVSVFVSLIFSGLDKFINSNQTLSSASKIGGLFVGILLGGLIGLIAVYSISIVRELGQPGAVASQTPVDNTARKLAGKMIAAATTYTYPEATKFSEAFVSSPVAMGKSLHRVANNPDIKSLVSDEYYQRLLARGDAQNLIREPLFQRLMNDADVQYFLEQSQLIPTDTQSEEVIARALIDSWQGFQAVRNDARVQEIMNDPEFQKKLQSGDKFALMNDAQLQELTEAFFQAAAKARSSTTER
jgi:uncharacterized membrane protein required for colicin V production